MLDYNLMDRLVDMIRAGTPPAALWAFVALDPATEPSVVEVLSLYDQGHFSW